MMKYKFSRIDVDFRSTLTQAQNFKVFAGAGKNVTLKRNPDPGGQMSEEEFDGSLILEKLAAADKLNAFYEAVDQDQLGKVRELLKVAEIDEAWIDIVIQKIEDGEE